MARWIEYLSTAADDPDDPLLHTWARLCADSNSAEAWQEMSNKLATELSTWEKAAGHALDKADVVVSYSACGPEDWRQDGVVFGSRLARPGEWQLSDDPLRPVLRVAEPVAAKKIPSGRQ